jgi:hypothetical protein
MATRGQCAIPRNFLSDFPRTDHGLDAGQACACPGAIEYFGKSKPAANEQTLVRQ